jgi:hypothetical protein
MTAEALVKRMLTAIAYKISSKRITYSVDRRGVNLETGVQHGPRCASYIPLSLHSFQTQSRVTVRRRKGSTGRADLQR